MTLPLTYEALTDVGVERSENQDACGTAEAGDYVFYFVCDGMGGHRGGSTASTMAVEVIGRVLRETDGAIELRMQLAIEAANAEIHEFARQRRDLHGMGTTVVMLGIDRAAGTAHIAHVGDSRAYRLRGDVYRRFTKDHTWVQRLVDDGVLTPEAAEHHPHSNVISRSLGGRNEVEVEFTTVLDPIADGDIFLLCSDGLYGLVDDDAVARQLGDLSLAEAPPALVRAACDAGGHDNITVQVVLVGEKSAAAEAYAVQHPPNGHGHVTGRNTVPTPAVPAPAAPPTPDERDSDELPVSIDPFSDTLPDNEQRGSGTLIIVLAAAIGVALILIATLRPPSFAVDEPTDEPEATEGSATN